MATGAEPNARDAMPPRRGVWETEPLSTRSPVAALLLRAVDAGLVAALFLVPLLIGGRVALGQFALVALSLGIALCWCLRQGLLARAAWVRSPAAPLLLAALLLVALQLAPLPAPILHALSPQVRQTLPLWSPDVDSASSLGVWSTLSLTPSATRDTFVLLLAFVLLFLVTVQRVQRVEDVERLIRWIALSTVAMAAFALVHHFANNGKYFWFFEYPYSRPGGNIKGSFTNRNHFAQFIAIGVGPLIWWMQDAARANRRWRERRRGRLATNRSRADTLVVLRGVALALAVFAGLLSLSRGGAAAILVASLVALLVLYRGSMIGRRTLLSMSAVGLLVGACLCTYGYQPLARRLSDFCSVETLDRSHGRRSIWRANGLGIADHPLVGTGLGSHREVCPMYLPSKGAFELVEATHAENGYLQVGLETGGAGLLLLATAVGFCVFWCIACLRRPLPARTLLCFVAIASSLAASFVHALFDFVWYVPGCMVAVVVLAAGACRLWQLTGPGERQSVGLFWMPRGGWLGAAACLLLIGVPMVQGRLRAVRAEPFWYRYLGASKDSPGIYEAGSYEDLRWMAGQLSRVVERQPDHARAHSRLAAVHLRLFDHPQDSAIHPIDVRQVREAVLASGFESGKAMEEWLGRAFGPRCRHLYHALYHARRAVALCPLQGEAYLYLADVSFLAEHELPGKAAYVEQALKVRPFDGTVLFAAGQEAVLAGDFDRALVYWKASFQAGRVHQDLLLQRLAGQVDAAFLVETFQPDRIALGKLASLYGQRDATEELRFVRGRYAEACELRARGLPDDEAAGMWVEAAKTHGKLGNESERLRCLRAAVGRRPSHYDARCALGACLFRMGEVDEAEKHLSWCLREKPQDARVRAMVEALVDQRLRTASRTTGDVEADSRSGW